MKKLSKDVDFSEFGCNEAAIRNLVEAMGFGVEQKGVYVKAGMPIEINGNGGWVVAPPGTSPHDNTPATISWWDCEGCLGHAYPDLRALTYKGQPVLGYEKE